VSSGPQSARVLPFEEAYELIQRYCQDLQPVGTEDVALLQSIGRVLAEPVLADRDFPPFPRATRDGFAVRCADVKSVPAVLRMVGQVKAGSNFPRLLSAGEAVEIMTGAPVPSGSDAVVMVEYTARRDASVEIQRACTAGENLVPTGSEVSAGKEMLPRGTRLKFTHVAVASAVGKASLHVYKKPQVAILSTGDELVELEEKPLEQQIRNSNSYSLAAQVLAVGGEPWQLPIAPDNAISTRELIQQGLVSDLLLLSGGVSMGKFDLVEQALSELGAEFFFTGVAIQPGRPVVFGHVKTPGKTTATPFFGLPGNPVSTMVTFDLFAAAVLRALGGENPVRLNTALARLGKDIKTKTGLTRFLPAVVTGGLYDPVVEIVPWQGSGDLQAAARSNCYVVAPPDREFIAAGEMISILMHSCPN
jgi:molybdopterin molybdotransferase